MIRSDDLFMTNGVLINYNLITHLNGMDYTAYEVVHGNKNMLSISIDGNHVIIYRKQFRVNLYFPLLYWRTTSLKWNLSYNGTTNCIRRITYRET